MKGLWKGILYALVLAVPAAYLGKLYPIIGGPVFGILLGIICAFIPRGGVLQCRHQFYGQEDFAVFHYPAGLRDEFV